MLVVEKLNKSFTLHIQGSVVLTVLTDISMVVNAGECIVLDGSSGSGKSTLMKCLYGNYLAGAGSIRVRHDGAWVEMLGADAKTVLAIRRQTIGYVSQFLRAVPRVPAIEVVAETLIEQGASTAESLDKARACLARLNIPQRLWSLAPATFSGGEQQRVNIARVFIADYPILLLDEPTASLDAVNRRVVLDMINEAKASGAAIVGIFHDAADRAAVADRLVPLATSEPAA